MRIIQLIDSLEIGGAEKMAVNYANALAEKIAFSGLVATRKEGNLKDKLSSSVSYLFLERKNLFDLKAVLNLKRYCKANKVSHIQAHSSSFFLAVLVKLIYFKIRIIWHDHNGLSEHPWHRIVWIRIWCYSHQQAATQSKAVGKCVCFGFQ